MYATTVERNNPLNAMRYFEIAAKEEEGFVRNLFRPVEEKPAVIGFYQGWEDAYLSVYDYEFDVPPTADSDFDNAPKYGDLYFDLDSEDIELAAEESTKLIGYFVGKGVKEQHIKEYFSGAKGYHVLIPSEYIMNPTPTLTHILYKQIATALKNELSLSTLDTKVYDARRVFRIPGSVNSKTGMQKIKVKDFSPISEPVEPIVLPSAYIPEVEKVEPMKKQEKDWVNVKQPLESFILRMINSAPPEGERNNHAYTCALYLKDHGYAADEAYALLDNSPTTLPRRELQAVVQSAYRGDKHFGMKDNELVHSMLTPEERVTYNVDDATVLLVPWKQVMNNTKEQIEKFRKRELLSYGISSLDNYLGMISAGELVTVGGVSGIGKSEFVWNIAKANARAGIPVAFIGIEMSPEMYTMRMLKNKMGVDGSKFKTLDFSEDERRLLEENLKQLEEEKLPIYFFNPKYQIDVAKLDKLVEVATKKYGIKLWVIDHLHYFPASSADGDSHQVISHIVTSIKQMTLKYDVPIVLVSHYRKLQYGTKASLNSFKDSIAIPQVSDTVIALDRSLTSEDLAWQRRVEVSVLKSRYGMASATFYVDFNPSTGTYIPTEGFHYGLGTADTKFD